MEVSEKFLNFMLSIIFIIAASSCKTESPATPVASFPTTLYTRTVNYQENASSFSIVQLTDLHIGTSANFTASYDHPTPPPAGSDGIEADYLRNIVLWINNNIDTNNIKFVIVSGDITDSGSLWQFVKAKEILDQLTIPYIPMMGNHDVWPKGSSSIASTPIGDSYFRDVFGAVFTALKTNPMFSPIWDDGTRNTPVTNPSYPCDNYYQNFYFSYEGYSFLLNDFNARYLFNVEYEGVIYYTGAGVKGELTYTWDNWFQTKYNSLSKDNKDRILIFNHIPAISWSHPTTGVQYGFESSDLSQITDFLYNTDNYNDTGLWAGGHLHTQTAYDYYINVYTPTYQVGCPQIVAQTAQEGKIQLITLYNN